MRCALACVALAGLLGPMGAAPQPRSPVDTVDLFKMRADFTVPESPAFKLVDVDESAILRPASVRELAVAFSSFTDSTDGGLRLPKSVGIEVAPWLAGKSRSVKRPEYARRAWLYRFRVSGAVHTSEGARRPHELAGGLRFTFLDDADVRLDTILEQRILVILERIADVHMERAQCSRRAGVQRQGSGHVRERPAVERAFRLGERRFANVARNAALARSAWRLDARHRDR